MENLNKTYKKNKNLIKIKEALKTAGFENFFSEDVFIKTFRKMCDPAMSLNSVIISEDDRKRLSLECHVNLDEFTIYYVIVGFGGEVNFGKEIPEEALLEWIDEKNESIAIFKIIQKDISNIIKTFTLGWKYEIDKIIK